MKEINVNIESHKDKITLNSEEIKEMRIQASQARRAELAARQRLDRASRAQAKAIAKEQQLMSTVVPQATDTIVAASKAVQETLAAARSAENSLAQAVSAVEGQFKIVNHLGKAVDDGVVDAKPEAVSGIKKAMGQLTRATESHAARQAELEGVEEELITAIKDQTKAQIAST